MIHKAIYSEVFLLNARVRILNLKIKNQQDNKYTEFIACVHAFKYPQCEQVTNKCS